MTNARDETRAMLARRPHRQGVAAFGHVNVDRSGRDQLHEIVRTLVNHVSPLTEVDFHPDDLAGEDEVLVAPLDGFDDMYQSQAPWSLERAVAEVRATGIPPTLTSGGVVDGNWTFYVVRSRIGNKDAVAIRAKSPSWGLKSQGKLLTRLVGEELRLVDEPLLAFDHRADALVVGKKVYVLQPRQLETLLIDAEAVKARASSTAASFRKKLKAALASQTATAVERVCSHNANVARRVERLLRDGELSRVTAAEVRKALPDAGLRPNDFGSSGPLQAVTDAHATVLIDIAADLYYQPRFADAPRRVAVYRRVG
jgi:Domain of unknown function (DUF4868)